MVPRWLTLLVAAVVSAFGAYRIWIALRRDGGDGSLRQRGLFGQPPRRHLLFGIVYLLMGALLVASALGIRISPFAP